MYRAIHWINSVFGSVFFAGIMIVSFVILLASLS